LTHRRAFPYNNRVRFVVLILALGLSLSFLGCSTRSSGTRSGVKSNKTSLILFEEELEARNRGEILELDILATRNKKVEHWLDYFQGRGRKWFYVWMERSGKYIPFMRKVLRDHGLPEDLVWLSMIESGFSSKAFSRARAVGQWQFMKATGRRYGLRVDFWRDERRDPEKATLAAARHLKDLYDRFQNWKLAAAAYNAGEGKISRAIRRYKTEDFWELTRGRYLKPETKNYVPKLIAAALIAKDPEQYGFKNIKYADPLTYDKVILKQAVNLQHLSEKAGFALKDVMALNPELNHAVTPPNEDQYELRVPTGASEKFLVAFNSLKPGEFFQYATHRVRRGDTISHIARNYGVSQREIFRLNKIKSARRIRPGQTLILPVPKGVKLTRVAKNSAKSRRSAPRQRRKKSPPPRAYTSDRIVHVVKRGESLWSISRRYRIPISKIKRENNLRRSTIYAGKVLHIPAI